MSYKIIILSLVSVGLAVINTAAASAAPASSLKDGNSFVKFPRHNIRVVALTDQQYLVYKNPNISKASIISGVSRILQYLQRKGEQISLFFSTLSDMGYNLLTVTTAAVVVTMNLFLFYILFLSWQLGLEKLKRKFISLIKVNYHALTDGRRNKPLINARYSRNSRVPEVPLESEFPGQIKVEHSTSILK